MKFGTYSAVSILLIATLFILTTPMLGSPTKKERRVKEVNVENGQQVGERLRRLKDTNANVKAALAEFEKNGRHHPKLDEAVTFSGKVEETETAPVARNNSPFRQASFFKPQTFTDTGVDVTFITSVNLYDEWQGTVIAHFYDAAGVLVETAVHDLVITRSQYAPSEWTARYDLIVLNGVPYLAHVPGMYTGFLLGVPILNQTPPQDIQEWQFADPVQEQQYYDLYPQQRLYDTPPDRQPPGILPMVSVSMNGGRGLFHAASFFPQRPGSETDRRSLPPGQRPGGVGISGGRQFGAAVGIGCTGAGASCGIAGMFTAGGAFGPCMASRCGGVVVASALAYLRLYIY